MWREAGCFAVALPPLKEEDANALRYNKPVALHLWLFGYELPGASLHLCAEGSVKRALTPAAPASDTVLLFTPTAVHVACSAKKGASQRSRHSSVPP